MCLNCDVAADAVRANAQADQAMERVAARVRDRAAREHTPDPRSCQHCLCVGRGAVPECCRCTPALRLASPVRVRPPEELVTYVLHAGYVVSRTDGQRHWVGEQQLLRLYGIPRRARFVSSRRAHGIRQPVIHLRPRADGVYDVPRWFG